MWDHTGKFVLGCLVEIGAGCEVADQCSGEQLLTRSQRLQGDAMPVEDRHDRTSLEAISRAVDMHRARRGLNRPVIEVN